jgi:hypothetical protein
VAISGHSLSSPFFLVCSGPQEAEDALKPADGDAYEVDRMADDQNTKQVDGECREAEDTLQLGQREGNSEGVVTKIHPFNRHCQDLLDIPETQEQPASAVGSVAATHKSWTKGRLAPIARSMPAEWHRADG